MGGSTWMDISLLGVLPYSYLGWHAFLTLHFSLCLRLHEMEEEGIAACYFPVALLSKDNPVFLNLTLDHYVDTFSFTFALWLWCGFGFEGAWIALRGQFLDRRLPPPICRHIRSDWVCTRGVDTRLGFTTPQAVVQCLLHFHIMNTIPHKDESRSAGASYSTGPYRSRHWSIHSSIERLRIGFGPTMTYLYIPSVPSFIHLKASVLNGCVYS